MEAMLNEFSEHIRQSIRTGKRPDPNNPFALYVRLCRRKQNLSMVVLSERSGLSKSTLLTVESGYLMPEQLRQEERFRLEQELGVSYECFTKLNRHIIEEMTDREEVDKRNISSEDAEPALSL